MTSVAVDVGGTFADVARDWGTGELLERTTEQFRAMLKLRAVDHWAG